MKSISPYMGPSKIIAFVHMVVGLLKKSCSCGAWDEPGNPMGKLETPFEAKYAVRAGNLFCHGVM